MLGLACIISIHGKLIPYTLTQSGWRFQSSTEHTCIKASVFFMSYAKKPVFQARGYRGRQLPSQRNLSAREEKAPGRVSYTHAAGGGHTGLSFLGYKMSSGAEGMTAYLSLLPPNR